MAISNSLQIGASGLNLFQNALTVTSDNIANVETVGYKENRTNFAELISRGTEGMRGANFQVGQGGIVHDVRNIFTQGAFDASENPFDLMIDGEGFFVMQDPLDETRPLYSRAGDFHVDKNGFLVNASNFLVMGSGLTVDPETGLGTLGESGPIDLSKRFSLPQATDKANFTLNLSSQVKKPITVIEGTKPTVLEADGTEEFIINGKSFFVPGGDDIQERIEDLFSQINDDASVLDTGVTAEYLDLSHTSLRLIHQNGGKINVDMTADPSVAAKIGLKGGLVSGKTIAGTVSAESGESIVTGFGTKFKSDLHAGDAIVIDNQRYIIQSVKSDIELVLLPLGVDEGGNLINGSISTKDEEKPVTQLANFTQKIVFHDSLGTPRDINMRFLKTSEYEWTWSAVVGAKDNANGNFDEVQASGKLKFLPGSGTVVGNRIPPAGLLEGTGNEDTIFPTDGFDFAEIRPTSSKPVDPDADPDAAPDLEGIAPTSDQQITFDFTNTTQFGTNSGLVKQNQNGFASAILTFNDMFFSSDGVLKARLSNGTTQDLYQLSIASFPNQEGLTRLGSNLYLQSEASGEAILGVAHNAGNGEIKSKGIEKSTVDLATQFVKLITYQRGFQANSKVIQTSDEITQELVNLKR